MPVTMGPERRESRQQRHEARGELGSLAIGFSFSTVAIVSRVLPQFRLRYPDVEVALHDLSSAEQMQRLLEGNLHAGFVRLPVHEGLAGGCRCRRVADA